MPRAPDGWRKVRIDGVDVFERWHGATRYRMPAEVDEGAAVPVAAVVLDDDGREGPAEVHLHGSRKGALRWVALRCRDEGPGYRARADRDEDGVPRSWRRASTDPTEPDADAARLSDESAANG
jgi:hypothetical protein